MQPKEIKKQSNILNIIIMIVFGIGIIYWTGIFNKEPDPSQLPESSVTYSSADDEIGSHSDLSDSRREEIFKSKYLNHWFTWEGEILEIDDNKVKLNTGGGWFTDLTVEFDDEKVLEGLSKRDNICVKFVMTEDGYQTSDFEGRHALLIKRRVITKTSDIVSIEDAQDAIVDSWFKKDATGNQYGIPTYAIRWDFEAAGTFKHYSTPVTSGRWNDQPVVQGTYKIRQTIDAYSGKKIFVVKCSGIRDTYIFVDYLGLALYSNETKSYIGKGIDHDPFRNE